MNKEKRFQQHLLALFNYQILIVTIIAVIVLLLCDKAKFFALLVGASSYLLPQLFFTIFVCLLFKIRRELFMLCFFIGESLKIIIASVLCIITINYLALNHLFAILGFVTGVLSLWLIYGCYFSCGKYLQRV